MTLVVYMFDPMHIRAEAYRPSMKPEDGAAFLHLVLEGKALATE